MTENQFAAIGRAAETALVDGYLEGVDDRSAEQAEWERLVDDLLPSLSFADALAWMPGNTGDEVLNSLDRQLRDAIALINTNHPDALLALMSAQAAIDGTKRSAAGVIAQKAIGDAQEEREAQRQWDRNVFGRAFDEAA